MYLVNLNNSVTMQKVIIANLLHFLSTIVDNLEMFSWDWSMHSDVCVCVCENKIQQ